ncbi:MAG: HAD family hydrolase [Alphaproteobacteria bacterium]|nr:HAD family hydrolase [Alphaproteobacteria bacterium]
MSPSQQAVIFDWNGTLLADTKRAVEATNAATALFGLPPTTVKGYQKAYVMPLKKMYVGLGCKEQDLEQRLDEVFATWGAYYEEGACSLRLRRGARKLLAELKARGNRAAILSNHTVKIITSHVERLGLQPYFDKILANGCHELADIMHKADKGSRLKAFTEKHDIRKALVVGDSPEEIKIAHHYGFLGVGIAGGYCAAERILAAKPDFMITSLSEMPAIVRKVFGTGSGA